MRHLANYGKNSAKGKIVRKLLAKQNAIDMHTHPLPTDCSCEPDPTLSHEYLWAQTWQASSQQPAPKRAFVELMNAHFHRDIIFRIKFVRQMPGHACSNELPIHTQEHIFISRYLVFGVKTKEFPQISTLLHENCKWPPQILERSASMPIHTHAQISTQSILTFL